MNDPFLLLGVGSAGAATARTVARTFGPAIRLLAVDTDAATGSSFAEGEFVLLGGSRLAGRGAGGQPASARAALQDDPSFLDAHLAGVRTVFLVMGLGGGTASGTAGELLRHLAQLGIVTFVFATTPFPFEGESRLRNANAATSAIAQHADAYAILPLDELVSGTERLAEGLAQAQHILATGLTLFWRLLAQPGYLKLDGERLRALLVSAGRARFAVAEATGTNRVGDVLQSYATNAQISTPGLKIRQALIGILAGDDLRLAEIDYFINSLKSTFAPEAEINLGTVNDESAFAGKFAAVTLLFEERTTPHLKPEEESATRRLTRGEGALAAHHAVHPSAEKTFWHGEDLDTPTYIRRNLSLDR